MQITNILITEDGNLKNYGDNCPACTSLSSYLEKLVHDVLCSPGVPVINVPGENVPITKRNITEV
ncbi:hypothetical protein KAU11_12760, partial [Candidatus Babeliales bacterium]|nr:hypothetical protein [Candidatus Babeliales bacterium]